MPSLTEDQAQKDAIYDLTVTTIIPMLNIKRLFVDNVQLVHDYRISSSSKALEFIPIPTLTITSTKFVE